MGILPNVQSGNYNFSACSLRVILIHFAVLFLPGTIPVVLKGQGTVNDRTVVKWYKEADALYNLESPTTDSDEKALKLFVDVAGNKGFYDRDLKVHALIKAGNIHLGYNRFALANGLYHWALQINKPADPALNYEVFLYLGSSMYFNGIIDSAKIYFERASEISIANNHKNELPEQDRLYNSLGAIYYQSANYQQAFNYLETALDFAVPGSPDYEDLYVSIKSNIASCLLRLNLFDSALNILRKLSRISPHREFVSVNMAHAYFENGKYDTALAIYNRVPFASGLFRVSALNDIGRIYLYKKNWKKAKEIFDSAIVVNRSIRGKVKSKEEALSNFYLAELAQKQGNLKEAIGWCNKAITILNLDFTPKAVFDLPDDVSKTISPIDYYQVLNFKAELLYQEFLKERNPALETAALAAVVKAVETANYISKNLDNDDAKLFFIENAQKYYEQAVKIAYDASQENPARLDDLVFILEGYKGNILRQNMESKNLKRNSGIPDSLTKRENELKGLYAVYLSKLNEVTDEKESSRIQKKLSNIQVSLSRLQKSYEKFELFTWVKNSRFEQRLTLGEIRKALDNKTALVNYFVAGDAIYLLAISKSEVKASRVALDPAFRANLKRYMDQCFRIEEGIRYEGYTSSYEVFRYLITPVYGVIKNNPRLVIIPDKYLFQLPFDGLVSSLDKERQYLVKDHSISFHYSFSLLMQGLGATGEKPLMDQGILAFAPFSDERNQNPVSGGLFLPYSAEEINLAKARKFFASGATKPHFLKEYPKYGVLHLATHASLGNDSSSNWIQFYPEKDSLFQARLYVHEVYNLHLFKNCLVILSACESGSGLTVGGEGLMSLSRAFMYAGAGGIVSTLYKTDDQVTAFLLKRFYKHLGHGLEPSEALRQSKIDLLETDELNPRLKTPNYWSNFVYIGQISSHSGLRYFWMLPFVLAVVSIIYFLWKKRRNVKTISA